MKVMISQLMNGKSEEEIIKERERVIKKIKESGNEYIDTVYKEEADGEVKNKRIYYLGRSIEDMSKADIVYFMEGWREGLGCRVEHLICDLYGIEREYEGKGGVIDGYKGNK